MGKEKTKRSTKYPGIHLYDPNAKSKRYYISTKYKGKVLSRKLDKDRSVITNLQRAKQYLQELKDEIDQSLKHGGKDEMLYRDFVEQVDMPQHQMEVRKGTYRQNETIYKILIDWFGSYKLKDISVELVENFKKHLSKERKVSTNYGNLILAILKKSLNRGVSRNYLEYNVMDKVIRFKEETTEMKIWTLDQFQKVLDQMNIADYKESMYYHLFVVLFLSGTRIGELQALYWEDVDFDKNKIYISHLLDYKNHNDWKREYRTKSKSGKRDITLDVETMQMLRNWKERQAKHCKTKLVFSLKGHPITISSVNNNLKRFARLAEVPLVSVHALRHSNATYLIENGVTLSAISKRLGHSKTSTTFGIYLHCLPNSDEMIAEQLSGVIKHESINKDRIE